jgi:membrane-associated phospholipid phosphatase
MKRNALKTGRSAAVLLAALLLCSPVPAGSAPQDTAEKASDGTRFDRTYLRNFGLDFGRVITSPARWTGSDWAIFAAVAGAGTALYLFDRDLYDGVQRNKTEFTSDASSVIRPFGNGGYLLALAAGMYGAGELFDEPGVRRTALLSLESFLTTSAIVLGLKAVVGRARPYSGETPRDFHPFSFKNSHYSFPSGDAAGAFSVATTIADQTDDFVVDAVSYGLAGLVAIYRVHDRKHWPSDVFAGSAIGYFVAKQVCRLNRDREAGDFHVAFRWTRDVRAVTLTLAF